MNNRNPNKKQGTTSTLGYSPDLTAEHQQLRGGGGNHYGGGEYGGSDKNSNCSSAGSKAQRNGGTPLLQGGVGGFNEMRPLSEHFYEQPMVVFPPASGKTKANNASPLGSMEKTPFLDKTSSAGRD